MASFAKKKKILKIACCFFVAAAAVFCLPDLVSAAPAPDVGMDYPKGTGLSNAQDIRIIIARIIRIFLGFLGIVAVGLIIYAGWLWMSSQGNEEKIGQAKKILTNAVIGLIIIAASFAIASFVLNKLLGNAGDGGSAAPGGGTGGGISALGSGIISSHYPERNQKDVARNAKIAVTFKEAMDPSTIMSGDKINAQNIKIYKTKDGISGAVAFDVRAGKTEDNKTFIFKPSQYLGSAAEKIWYSVALGKNIKKTNGDPAFGSVLSEVAYDWMFEVGTFADNTPPKVESVVPAPSSTEPRNVLAQINFSEAVDPVSASGIFKNRSGFNNIQVSDNAAGALIDGNFYISNQYRTVEFLTFEACGVNSCGQTVYCLPGNKQIKIFISAAALASSDSPQAVFPYSGIVDMADNSFDGNADGAAQGPKSQSNLEPYNANGKTHDGQGDDFYWLFNTNDAIDVSAPKIERISPPVGASGVDLSAAPQAVFTKLLMSSALNSASVNLASSRVYNYWITKSDNFSDRKTTVSVNHDQFDENSNYAVQMNSGVKDIYQNCYTPCSGLGITGNPSCCDGRASNSASCQ